MHGMLALAAPTWYMQVVRISATQPILYTLELQELRHAQCDQNTVLILLMMTQECISYALLMT